MARPPKTASSHMELPVPPHLAAWAEALGEALGRGVARGLNSGLAGLNLGGVASGNSAPTGRRRGRPPKAPTGPVPEDRQCKMPDCSREARSKGLCSAHYQQERRKTLQQNG